MLKLSAIFPLLCLLGCVPPVESNFSQSLSESRANKAERANPAGTGQDAAELGRLKIELENAQAKETLLNEQIEKQQEEIDELNSVISDSKQKLESVIKAFDSIGNDPETEGSTSIEPSVPAEVETDTEPKSTVAIDPSPKQ